MNKAELVSAIAKRADVTNAQVDAVIDGLQQELVEAITRGDKVAIPGLITVERSQRSARTGRNPRPASRSRSPPRTPPRSAPAPTSRRPLPPSRSSDGPGCSPRQPSRAELSTTRAPAPLPAPCQDAGGGAARRHR